MLRGLRLTAVCAGLLACPPAVAQADWQFAPLLGLTFKSDASLTLVLDLETHWNFGGAVTLIGSGPVGVEAVVMVTPDFLEIASLATELPAIRPKSSSLVYAVMGNVVIAAPLHWNEFGLRPFISGGLGLIHASQETTTPQAFPIDINLLGYNVGGGATGFLTDRAGVRFDLRYYRTLSRTDEAGVALGPARIRFWTAAIGLVLRF